jgi:hypothetical protein
MSSSIGYHSYLSPDLSDFFMFLQEQRRMALLDNSSMMPSTYETARSVFDWDARDRG